MRKATVTLIICAAIFPVIALAETLFSDNFEHVEENFSAWTTADPGWSIVQSTSMNDTRHARAHDTEGTALLYKELDTTGYTDIVISHYFRVMDALEEGDVVVLEWTADRTAEEQTWMTIASWGPAEESTATLVTHSTLPSGANNNPNFAFRFRAITPATSDDFRIDDIHVTGTLIPPPAPPAAPMIGSVPPECADGSDNDGNGAADHPRDTGCSDSLDADESGGIPNIPIAEVPPPAAETPRSAEGEVLGVATEEPPLPPACVSAGLYLRDYLRAEQANDPEQVKLLQLFLNEEMGANIPVTGVFGLMTKKWVKEFQKKYHAEILQPWMDAGYNVRALRDGTGYVFKTTRRHINLMKCNALNIPMPPLTLGA